ncbi:hypothetical protein IFM89_024903 [Coptis chinensis]|uniref:SKI-interacting protein SKIP SNW domain-containing protein n=1 Tax=Coptis chinensis TaxID=261450 RepID=A0A835M1K4_9MAGN|nr:hypothetical protein IFM89_024903 [Coptis chinensis]
MVNLNTPPVKSTETTNNHDHTNDDAWLKQRFPVSKSDRSASVIVFKSVLPYLQRAGFIPRKPKDFGDGGAFPEIHVVQYPLGLGFGRKGDKTKLGVNILALAYDSEGNIVYDSIVKQGENASKIVYSQYRDLVPKILFEDGYDEQEEEIADTTQKTKAAIEKILVSRLNVPSRSCNSSYIKYTPSQRSADHNSGAKERIIRMTEMLVDPLEPAKFKHKKVPKPSGSPPVPVMHSPPRPVAVKDKQGWKITPCISNWKNPKGYTILLENRLVADGRGLQEVQINDNFAKVQEALYVAERKSREAVAMRSKLQKEILMKEKDRREQELQALAQKARSEGSGRAPPPSFIITAESNMMMKLDDQTMIGSKRENETREERLVREKVRGERRTERKRERRLEAKDVAMGKKSKITRDRDRDISEKVALGMANTGAGRGGEVMYDQRLFNQEKGMDSGFAADDQYNVYGKKLCTAKSTLDSIYKPKKDTDTDMYGGEDEQLNRVLKTDRFKPDKGFAGANETAGPREKPIEFEIEPDPFELDHLWTKVMKGK